MYTFFIDFIDISNAQDKWLTTNLLYESRAYSMKTRPESVNEKMSP